jgi:hypothetical protein
MVAAKPAQARGIARHIADMAQPVAHPADILAGQTLAIEARHQPLAQIERREHRRAMGGIGDARVMQARDDIAQTMFALGCLVE